MPQQTIWLHQATAEESVGRSLREKVQVHSSSVSLVLQESTQQRGIQLKFTTILQLAIDFVSISAASHQAGVWSRSCLMS